MQSSDKEPQKPREFRPLTREQADIIGEVSNVSMGSSATALSNIINKKVTITSPHVETIHSKQLESIQPFPSVNVIVSYTSGISGSNLLVIREQDAAEIVREMTGGMLDESESDFGEMHLSAIGEVMNQMMGSSATALAGFIGRAVNISTPSAFIVTQENVEQKMQPFQNQPDLVLVRFLFRVEDTIESDIYMIMTPEFADELVECMLARVKSDGQAGDVSAPPQPQAPADAQPEEKASGDAARIAQQMQPQAAVSAHVAAAAQAAPAYAPAPAREPPVRTSVRPVVLPAFDTKAAPLSSDESANFDLIQDVPLDLSVEVGRTRKKVREVIDFSVGSIIELDKQAGDPVDIIVNGQRIAHGEVVVIDENFGVRVTEIIGKEKSGGK